MSNNSFTMTAYAAEQQPDGTITTGRQLVFNQTNENFIPFWGQGVFTDNGDFGGTHMYMGIAFKCEGSNIKSVTLSVDEGSFSIVNTDYHTYYDIERSGSTHTINEQEIVNSEILWGVIYRQTQK